MKRKVIGVGVSKTGTHSLARACQMLGWRVIHFPKDPTSWRECITEGIGPVTAINKNDGACDIQAFAYWRPLVRRFPDALYVLTRRDDDEWIASTKRHFQIRPGTPKTHQLRLAFYRSLAFNPETYLEAKQEHERNVIHHFESNGKLDQLLLYDLCAGAGWDPLCKFLGVDVPDAPFPHLYKSQ